ncbi:MAG TPA: serine/threonine-protein kinase [Holophaga sp.]|nr:serine/threonine-protein kinase [Holophaga sp.]
MARMIGKYEVIRSLGAGAMGEVFLAHQAAIGREVAIKTILPSVARGEDAEGRFRREAGAAGKLSHPNLVTIFDFDKDGDTLYLVMEYVKGDDLEAVIRDQSLSHAQFLDVLAQVCDGLSHAHRNGIIHRDIKPANVRVVRDGRNLQAKVMDFGIARVEDSSMTATGIVMGTVSYMAPEYIRGGHATTQSDLFAVGVMLYECLTGRKPFAGDNTTTILFKIVSETAPPIDVSQLRGISPSIRAVLDKALSKDPAERFQTADDLAKALRACKDPSWTGTLEEATAMIARHQTVAPPPQPSGDATALVAPPRAQAPGTAVLPQGGGTAVLPPAAPAPVPPRGRAGLYAALGALGLAAAGGAGWFFLRSGAPAPQPVPAPVQASPAMNPAPAPEAAKPDPARTEQAEPAKAEPSRQVPAPAPKAEPPKAEPSRQVPAPAPKAEPPKAEPPKAEPPKAEPPKAAQKITALLAADPRLAAAEAKAAVAMDPGNAELQGLYLASLYRSRNAWDFERALARATRSGVTVSRMLAACPAFKAAIAEELRLRKTNPSAMVLPEEVILKVQAAL